MKEFDFWDDVLVVMWIVIMIAMMFAFASVSKASESQGVEILKHCVYGCIPDYLQASISWRPAYAANKPDDYLICGKAVYTRHIYRLEWERENGYYFLNYSAFGRYGLSETYYCSWKSEIIGSKGIDWQSLMVMWRSPYLVDAGANVTSHAYSHPQGAVSLALPLPGEGSLVFTTDFDDVHVWDGNTTKYFTREDAKVRPYIEVHYISENGELHYRGEVGVEIRMKDEG